MPRAVLLVLVLAACGRLGFDPQASADAAVGETDASDAAVARPEVVQVRTANNADGTAITVNLDPTRAGGLIVIATLCFNIGATFQPVLSVVDDVQNTYVSSGALARWNGDDGAVELWYAANARPGASLVRVASTGTTSRVAWALELANIAPTSPLESAVALEHLGQAMPFAPDVSASGSAAVVSLIMINGTITQVAAGNPFVLLPVINGDAAAYAIVDAPGTYGAVVDAPGSSSYAAITAAFRGLGRP